MSKILLAALDRLENTADETAMRAYKPKTGAQLRPKTDPAHRLMRQAYRRRTSGDKARQHRLSLMYRRKNASQIKQRQKRSHQLHPKPVHRLTSGLDDQRVGYWCYSYVWRDGLRYSIVAYGTRLGCDSTAQRLNWMYDGELVSVTPTSHTQHDQIQQTLPLAAQHESDSSKNSCSACVYAGHSNAVKIRHFTRTRS